MNITAHSAEDRKKRKKQGAERGGDEGGPGRGRGAAESPTKPKWK